MKTSTLNIVLKWWWCSMFTQEQLDIVKSRIRTPDLNPPYMRVEIQLDDGSWIKIQPPFLQSVSKNNGFGKIGRAVFTIKSDGVRYNYLKGIWQGILNKRGRNVKVYEGWGNFIVLTFSGKIAKWDMGASGEEDILINITCLNQLEELKQKKTVGREYIDSRLDEVMGDLARDASIETNTSIAPYTTEEPDPALEPWYTGNSITDTYRATSDFTYLNKYRYILTLQENRIKVYNLDRNRMEEEFYGFQDFQTHPWEDGNSNDKAYCWAVNKFDGKAFTVGRTYSRWEWLSGIAQYGWRDYHVTKVTMWDFDKRVVRNFSQVGAVWQKPRNAVYGYDGNLYVLFENKTIYRGIVDYDKHEVTWELLATVPEIQYINGSLKADIFQITNGTISIFYLKQDGGYVLKSLDLQYLEFDEPVESTNYNPQEYDRSFYNGFIITLQGYQSDGLHYTVFNPMTGETKHTVIQRVPNEGQYSYSKNIILDNRFFYAIPVSTTSDYISDKKTYTVFYHRVNFNGSDGEQQTYKVSNERPVLSALTDATADAGMELYADNETGEIKIEYPTVKEIPDYSFLSSLDVTALSHKAAEDAIDRVIIYFGIGSNSGVIDLGTGNNIYKRIAHNLNHQQAYTLATRLLSKNGQSIAEIAGRSIPNLSVGKTVDLNDGRMIGYFKGVIIEEDTVNTLQDGFVSKWKVLGA